MAVIETRSMKFATVIVGHLKAASYLELSVLALAVIFMISYATSSESSKPVGAPFAPKKWKFAPSAIQKLRFTIQARDVLQEAGGNLQYKDRIYILPRFDRDITIIPFKYLEELRSMPRTVLNATHAQAANLCAQYTHVDFLFHSDLLLRVVNNKLTPNLNMYVNWAQEEMNEAFHSNMPRTDDWIELDIQDKIHEVVSRMVSRVILGKAVSQNK
ncbi:hypothetical protein PTT_08282 [Pyrenophora teres f. teres 0-1]|uniref:Uncharacterized protein n=1 Tax=Pyrenophora teres f. teres (strain 0-1) TaxID=861557 RepID=E3RJF8_PYRTT|nr:hypothetical protein PTT_08282 [Pyrenophora teres f. teres 0-1]